MLNLADAVKEWDEKTTSEEGWARGDRPFHTILRNLQRLAPLRLQPYQNEPNPIFVQRLARWLHQFDREDQPPAFLLAAKVLLISQQQLEALQRNLFERHLRPMFHRAASASAGRPAWDFSHAAAGIERQMNNTLFIPNSDSSAINAFAHVNQQYFRNHGRRNLVGEPVSFWTHPSQSRRFLSNTDPRYHVTSIYESAILDNHRHIRNKSRIVVLEDFAGTGNDLLITLDLLNECELNIQEIVIAPIVATEQAMESLDLKCAMLNAQGKRRYYTMCSLELPRSWKCVNANPSFLDNSGPIKQLSQRIKIISDRIYMQHFSSLTDPPPRYGYGDLALALVLYANCPDNSLPMLWMRTSTWTPLFHRVSRYV